ncbi:hypothetical protein [Alcaligenes aquatilis]|uniref:hypothetical protein n=1 Tax=Alcaligenes aquatilis TaxID=323284 RepID=UPI003F91E177
MGVKWSENYSVETQRACGIAIGFAAGLVTAWMLYGMLTSWAMFKDAPWWDVMTAFGTVGAVWTALGVAVWQYLERRRERLTNAFQAAAHSYLQLVVYAAEVEVTRTGLVATLTDPARSSDQRIGELNHFQKVGDSYVLPPPSEFSPISVKLSAKLAAALGRMEVLKRQIELASSTIRNRGSMSQEDRSEFAEFFNSELSDVARLLRQAGEECRKAILHLDK